MGCNNTKKKKLNVVFLGSESSGKTSLLYKMRLKNANPIFDPTDSFNYEIIQQKYRDVMFELHAFDLAGKKELQICWPMFYENMPVDVLCVVVHACQREKIDDVKKIYKRLTNESNLTRSMKIIVSNVDKKDQINCFEEHICAAQENKMPLIVHTRSAEKETLEILHKNLKKRNFKILIHCFTGTREFAFKLLNLGAYISASGIITFKKSLELANTFKDLPNERILVETDAPYLAPVPFRGRPNEPSFLIHTVRFLSELKKLPFEELSNITTQNFFKLFGELN